MRTLNELAPSRYAGWKGPDASLEWIIALIKSRRKKGATQKYRGP